MVALTNRQPANNLELLIAAREARDALNPSHIHIGGPTRHVPIIESPSQVGHIPSVHLGVQNRHIASARMRPKPSQTREIAKRRIT